MKKYKKLVCLLIVVLMLFNSAIFAQAVDLEFSIETVAVELINCALSDPNNFHVQDLTGETLYLCNAINPYALTGGDLLACDDIEYYLLRTDDAFIACVTLCYDNGVLASSSLNFYVSDVLNANCNIEDEIQLVTHDGIVYVKTADAVSAGLVSMQNATSAASADTVAQQIANTADDLEALSIKSQLSGVNTNPIIPRSSITLSVPYVPQQGGTCWAAAGAAFGQYYTGDTYAHLTASDLATIMGIGLNDGAGFQTVRSMLVDVFGINTTYYNRYLSHHEAITLFQQAKPILAGFTGLDNNQTPAATVGHMVVLCGYADNGSGGEVKYYVRDSNYESIQIAKTYTENQLILDYYKGMSMHWSESAHYVYIP